MPDARLPEPERYALGPDGYLDQLRRNKNAVKVPVVASLNETSAETWLTFAQQMQQAGADALELNMYEVVTDPKQPRGRRSCLTPSA